MVDFLTWDDYVKHIRKHRCGHWKSYESQWVYHESALNLLKKYGVSCADRVLEAGTMGASLVKGSHLIDYAMRWKACGQKPNYKHDLRDIPWPIGDGKYEWFVALRVFQHLAPFQKECFLDARRVADRVIIVVPDSYKKGKGITLSEFTDWNHGVPPTKVIRYSLKNNYWLENTWGYCWTD